MRVLGIWDGHDAGAALVEDGVIRVAVNEERYTRKKIHVGFPYESIKACLRYTNTKPSEVDVVAASTIDFAKTLTRIIPRLKESYYHFRRHKTPRPHFIEARRQLKYALTEVPELPLCRTTTEIILKKQLTSVGLVNPKIDIIGHHDAHAASAAYCSGFKKAVVITLDGIGDNLSGTVNLLENGGIERLSSIPGRDSFGIFFEQVTSLLNMRELEDEGKVMALSDFAYDIPDEENKLMDFFAVDGLNVKAKHGTLGRYRELMNVLWKTKREDLAYMAQKTLEKHITRLFENALEETGVENAAWTGGVASNIKVNLKIRQLPKLKDWFVFPHMGDGGLAVGAALHAASQQDKIVNKRMPDVYFGEDYGEVEMEDAIKKSGFRYEHRSDIAEYAAELVTSGNIVLWFQGRMEYGPRSLGNRSILAPAGNVSVKDKLNLEIKERDFFQPFCPSLLEEEKDKIFYDASTLDRFMTMGYMTHDEVQRNVAAVTNVDGSARPQMLGDENPLFRGLISQVKKDAGYGIVLNTSFNLHGFPIVNTPADAVDMMVKSGAEVMCLGPYLVENE